MKKLTGGLTAAAMILTLSGCSETVKPDNITNEVSVLSDTVPENMNFTLSTENTGYFVPEEYTIPDNISGIFRCAAAGDRIYLTGISDEDNDCTACLYDGEKYVYYDFSSLGAEYTVSACHDENSAYFVYMGENNSFGICRFSLNTGKLSASESVQTANDGYWPYSMKTGEQYISVVHTLSDGSGNRLYRTTYDRDSLKLVSSGVLYEFSGSEHMSDLTEDDDGSICIVTEDNNMNFRMISVSADGKTNWESSDALSDIGGFVVGIYTTYDGNAAVLAYDKESSGIYHINEINPLDGGNIAWYDTEIPGESIRVLKKSPVPDCELTYTRSGKVFGFDDGYSQITQISDLNQDCFPAGDVLEAGDGFYIFSVSTGGKFTPDKPVILVTDQTGRSVYSVLTDEKISTGEISISGDSIYFLSFGSEAAEYHKDSDSLVRTKLKSERDVSSAAMTVTSEGNFVLIYWDGTAEIFDSSGNLIYEEELIRNTECVIRSAVPYKDGYAVLADTPEEFGQLFTASDCGAKPEKISTGISSITGLSEGFDSFSLCIVTPEGIYGLSEENGSLCEILRWINCGVSSYPENTRVYIPDRDTVVYSESSNTGRKVRVLKRADEAAAEKMKNKKIITAACAGTEDFIKEAAVEFNLKNPEYRIEITDYSRYNSNYTDSVGTDRFNMDLAAGTIPDIIIGEKNTDVLRLSKTGVFADLKALMENDSELNPDDFIPSVMDGYTTGGRIYQLPLSFTLRAVVCDDDIYGSTPGWNAGNFAETADGGMFYGVSREKMLRFFITENLKGYIDSENMTCSFDSGEFAHMLEFIKTNGLSDDEQAELQSDTDDYSAYRRRFPDGLCSAELMDIDSADTLVTFLKCDFLRNEAIRGIPSFRSESPVIVCDDFIGISEKSPHRDAAYEFVKMVLSETYQDRIGQNRKHSCCFSIRRDSFDKMLEEAEGLRFSASACTGDEISVNGIDDRTAANLKNAVYSASAAVWDSAAAGIISEQAMLYFSDAVSAGEAASAVQSKVSTYLSEIK